MCAETAATAAPATFVGSSSRMMNGRMTAARGRRRGKRHKERPELEVLGFDTLPYFLAEESDAFLMVLDPSGRAPDLLTRDLQALRLRFHAPEGGPPSFRERFRPFDESHAEFALAFLARATPSCRRFVVCSPEAEVRGPGLALGLADLLELGPEPVEDLERRYPRHSPGVRETLWKVAHPPQPLATRPEVKAASGILAFLTRYLS